MKFMWTCRETSKATLEGKDRPLSLREHLMVYMHLAMCGACRLFRKKVNFTHRLLRTLASPENLPDKPIFVLGEEKKKEIREQVKKKEMGAS